MSWRTLAAGDSAAPMDLTGDDEDNGGEEKAAASSSSSSNFRRKPRRPSNPKCIYDLTAILRHKVRVAAPPMASALVVASNVPRVAECVCVFVCLLLRVLRSSGPPDLRSCQFRLGASFSVAGLCARANAYLFERAGTCRLFLHLERCWEFHRLAQSTEDRSFRSRCTVTYQMCAYVNACVSVIL